MRGSAPARPTRKKRRLSGTYIWLAAILAVIFLACCFKIYMDNSFHSEHPVKELDTEGLNVEITDNLLAVRNPDPGETAKKTGIIFYQNLRVDGSCYLPLMVKLARLGYDCFLPVAFGNQPYLNADGAESVIRKYDTIENWVIAAHAAGCTPAASCAAEQAEKIHGLIYLGGHSDTDLSGLDIPFLSVIGTCDTVVDRKLLKEAMKNDPPSASYLSIEGGNNSGFADTKLLDGDSKGAISGEEQRTLCAAMIHRFLKEHIP